MIGWVEVVRFAEWWCIGVERTSCGGESFLVGRELVGRRLSRGTSEGYYVTSMG